MATSMTDLEKRCADALRLSSAAANLLLSEIQSNIETARAELVRSGVSSAKITEEGYLVQQAIIDYVCMQMGDEAQYDRYLTAFQYQQDNLRKTYPEESNEE